MNGENKLLTKDIDETNKDNLVCPKCSNNVIYCSGESRTYFKHTNGHMHGCDYYIYGESDYDEGMTDEDAAICCIITTLSCLTCVCCIPPLILFCDWLDSE